MATAPSRRVFRATLGRHTDESRRGGLPQHAHRAAGDIDAPRLAAVHAYRCADPLRREERLERDPPILIAAAIAEFERARIAERVKAGLQRAKAQGKRLGRPPRKGDVSVVVPGGSVRAAACVWSVSKSTAARWIAVGRHPGHRTTAVA